MTITQTAARRFDSHRDDTGVFEAALRVTTSDGTTGWAFYAIEWDKRDVISESLTAEAAIATALRDHIGDHAPAAFGSFGVTGDHGSDDALEEAMTASTEAVYG